jgi:peroxiredoxin
MYERSINVSIQKGDRIPAATLAIMGEKGPVPLTTAEIFDGKKVVLVSVPGAFTPTCSIRHLPGYVDLAEKIFASGVDTIAFVAVNDVFVMNAWGKSAGSENIQMLADGNGEFAAALGLELDASTFGMGMRSQRFALVAEDGQVTKLFVESPGEFRVSSAEYVLANL